MTAGGRRLSPLELLHPDGVAGTALVLGSGCPDSLRPSGPTGAPADLVIVADKTSAGEALKHVLPDGLVCVLGRGWRGSPLLHLPDTAASRSVSTRGAAGWALRHLVFSTAPRRALAAVADRAPAVVLRLPMHSTLLRPAGARPLLGWLAEHLGGRVPERVVVLASSRRESCTLLILGESGLEAVVKLGGNVVTETPTAPPGVEIPRQLGFGTNAGRRVTVESGIAGRSASIALGEHPRRVTDVLASLAHSLEAWHRATASERVVDAALLDRELLAPARAIESELDGDGAYVAWLERLCAEAVGASLPAVAAHNDLTMANLLLTDDGGLGIIDWETFRADGLPLVDYVYAATDAFAAGDRYADPAVSFAAAAHATEVTLHIDRIAAAVGLAPSIVELCVHACWLGHAANEARRPEGTRPFLRIARLLANSTR